MESEAWAPATWKLIHSVSVSTPDHAVQASYRILTKLCTSVPCPTCCAHARSFLARVIRVPINRDELVDFFRRFHNSVNERRGTPQISEDECDSIHKKGDWLECGDVVPLCLKSFSAFDQGIEGVAKARALKQIQHDLSLLAPHLDR